jgi:hypothetical protein
MPRNVDIYVLTFTVTQPMNPRMFDVAKILWTRIQKVFGSNLVRYTDNSD